MIVIRDPNTFSSNFEKPKDVAENLKCETEFIIKSNWYLAKIIMKETKLNNCY